MPSTALLAGCREGIIGLAPGAEGAEGFVGGLTERTSVLACRTAPFADAATEVGSSVRTLFKIGRLDVFGTRLLLGVVGVVGSGRGGGEAKVAASSSGDAGGIAEDGLVG